MEDFTKQEYYTDLEETAKDIIKEHLEDGTDCYDLAHERVDGDQWIIYNYYHDFIIKYTNNEEAYEELGPLEGDFNQIKQTGAYWAMLQDLNDEIAEQCDLQGVELWNLPKYSALLIVN